MPAWTVSTRMTSSVAYAVDEMASDAKIGRAIRFLRRWCPSSDVAIGRPIRIRFASDTIRSAHPRRRGAATSRMSALADGRLTLPLRARRHRRLRAGRFVTGSRPHRRRTHRRHHRPPVRVVQPARPRLQRPHRAGHRVRPRPADRGRDRGGRRPRRGDERRQLQHPRGPRRPGELRCRAGRRPHLRPPPGGDLPAARDHDGRHGGVDDRPGPAPAPPGGPAGRVDRPDGEGLRHRAHGGRRVGRASR